MVLKCKASVTKKNIYNFGRDNVQFSDLCQHQRVVLVKQRCRSVFMFIYEINFESSTDALHLGGWPSPTKGNAGEANETGRGESNFGGGMTSGF